MIVSMLEYVIVKIFLYLGVGAFIWRNVSIFEYQRWATNIFFCVPITCTVLLNKS